jgi:hypothetical protein
MPHPLEALRNMEYPGRVIVLGRDPSGDFDVVVYAVTGRSPSSQARRLDREGGTIMTNPTDPEVLKTGNPDLLVYPAVVLGDRIAVSNGKQTEDLARAGETRLVSALASALDAWSYEPDAPIFTPRISGLVGGEGRAALSLIRRAADGSPRRSYFEWTLRPGRAEMIATYAGPNLNPLPGYLGEPRPLQLGRMTPEETASDFYESLGPQGRPGDFRVAVACVFFSRTDPSRTTVSIINRHERNSR